MNSDSDSERDRAAFLIFVARKKKGLGIGKILVGNTEQFFRDVNFSTSKEILSTGWRASLCYE